MESNRYNAVWWSKDNDSGWEKVKEAFHRDWDQTKHDFGGNPPDLKQDVPDTVKQAAGKQHQRVSRKQAGFRTQPSAGGMLGQGIVNDGANRIAFVVNFAGVRSQHFERYPQLAQQFVPTWRSGADHEGDGRGPAEGGKVGSHWSLAPAARHGS